MKTHSHSETVTLEGAEQTQIFKIDTTAHAFSILSDKLYSDKIKAVIRELSCNAWDAHVAAGNPKTPFKLVLPTVLERNFIIRDYGTGLSNDDVMQIYATYFSSTKSNSNKFIGALGLGSKSFFAYTKNANVISYFNGKKSIYNAYINEETKPTISLIATMDTDEPNGMEISFECHKNDVSTFHDRAKRVFASFPVMPTCNIALEKYTPAYFGKHFSTNTSFDRSSYYDGTATFARQGNVEYPIKSDYIPSTLSHQSHGLTFNFAIGELDVAPSREELSYDARTIANIKKRISEGVKEFKEQLLTNLQKSIDEAMTLYAASRIYHNHYNTFPRQDYRIASKELNWKGKDLLQEEVYIGDNCDINGIAKKGPCDVDLSKVQIFKLNGKRFFDNIHVRDDHKYDPKGVKISTTLVRSTKIELNAQFFIDDVKHSLLSRIMANYGVGGRIRIYALGGDPVEIAKIVSILGDPETISAASLTYTPVKKTPAQEQEYTVFERHLPGSIGHKQGYSVTTDRQGASKLTNVPFFHTFKRELFLLDKFTMSTYDEYEMKQRILPIMDFLGINKIYFRSKADVKTENPALNVSAMLKDKVNSMAPEEIALLVHKSNFPFTQIFDGNKVKFPKEEMENIKKYMESERNHQFAEILSKLTDAAKSPIIKIEQKYPLLMHINLYHNDLRKDTKLADEIQEYINFKNGENK